MGTVVDITERREAEQALQFQTDLLAHVHDPMTATDENFVITYWNDAAERAFGWTREEVVGRPAAEILRSRVLGSSREQAMESLLSTGWLMAEVYYTRKDGTEAPFEVHTAALRGPDGRLTGTISVQREISERKEAETEREQLLARERELSRNLVDVNHELQDQGEELAVINEELQAQTEELRVQTEELVASEGRSRLLLRVAGAVAGWTDLAKVLDASLQAVVDATSHTRASIGLWEPRRQEIRMVASSGLEPMEPTSAPLERFSPALQQTIRTGRTAVVDYGTLPANQRGVADSYRTVNALLVPLIYHEEVIGVVLVDDPGRRAPFSHDEIQLIEGIGAQIAVAIENARLYEAQKYIADQLQRAIMDMPTEVTGLEFGHLYRSATEEAIVGGDFYDVFERPDGSVVLLAGDVSGHGVNAARVATMVKASLVAFAQSGDEPGEILTNANRLLMRKRVSGFTSVLFALYVPSTSMLTASPRVCGVGVLPLGY